MSRDRIAWLCLLLTHGCYLLEEEPAHRDTEALVMVRERTIGPLMETMAFVPHAVTGGQHDLFHVGGRAQGELELPLTVETLEGATQSSDGAVVLAFDTSLDFRWGVMLQSATGDDIVHDVALDPSGDVVAVGCLRCSTTSDPFVAKLDGASGALRWVRVFSDGPGMSALVAAAIDDRGDIVAAGYHHGEIAFDAFELAAADRRLPMLLKLGFGGATQWAKQLVTTGPVEHFAEVRDVAIAGDGSIALAGGKSRLAVVDFGGGIRVPDGDDFMLALLGADGTTRWAHGRSSVTARAVAIADDRIQVVGSNSGDVPVFDTRFWRYEQNGDLVCDLVEGTQSSFDNGRAIAMQGDVAFVASDVRATDQAAMLTRIDEDCAPHFEARAEHVAASLSHALAFDAAAGLLYSTTTQIWDEAAQTYRYQGIVRTYDAL